MLKQYNLSLYSNTELIQTVYFLTRKILAEYTNDGLSLLSHYFNLLTTFTPILPSSHIPNLIVRMMYLFHNITFGSNHIFMRNLISWDFCPASNCSMIPLAYILDDKVSNSLLFLITFHYHYT